MVRLVDVRAANATLCRRKPLTAVFAGATAGIGEATLRTLASTSGPNGKGLRVYVIGRKKETTEKILADCSRVCPDGEFILVPVKDLSLIEEVDKACAEITDAVRAAAGDQKATVDLLCMSQGDFNFSPRTDTKEGLEFRVSLLYYSRVRMIINLLPLLLTSDLPAHVISVFGAGKEAEFHLDDMSLREAKHWGMLPVRGHVCLMHTFFFEQLAAQHPGKLSLVHVFPGLVMTKAFQNPGVPLWGRILFTILGPILGLISTPVAEAGERTLFLASPQRFPPRQVAEAGQGSTETSPADGSRLPVATGTDGNIGSGAYGVSIDGETCHNKAVIEKYRAAGVGAKIWEHTMQAFDTITSGKVWTQ